MTVSLDKLLNSGLDNTYMDFANTLKETLRATSTSTPLTSGYEFEGAKYFDGKVQKIFHNGSWQDHLDFSKVNMSDVLGLPAITSSANDNNLNSLVTLGILKQLVGRKIHYYPPIDGGHRSIGWNVRKQLAAGRNYSIDSKTGKVYDYEQTFSYAADMSEVVVNGIAVIEPTLANSRILIQFREILPSNFIMSTTAQITKIGIQRGITYDVGVCSDWGQQDSHSGFYIYITDPDTNNAMWTSNPENSYSEKAYIFTWEIKAVDVTKVTSHPPYLGS